MSSWLRSLQEMRMALSFLNPTPPIQAPRVTVQSLRSSRMCPCRRDVTRMCCPIQRI
ncbi:hypothetical protein CHELA40_10902 [Chelatococcus asaccharovorans]|nr:hypothetical protein CHELA40_10902 [Chelatococcus asaccharovorans]CAH1685819.1 hypothetical protein CHELA17_64697 [Chelatococcus asaccharovorans]